MEENKMPNKDRTGPLGQGAMTGRGLGPCGCGNGMRKGFGRGLGRDRCPAKFSAGFSKEDEKKILEAELKQMETDKQNVEKRLKEIK
jgi:hypothetical protein